MMINRFFRRQMSCKSVLVVIQSYIDGETDDETARLVLLHLQRCRRCDDEIDVFRQIKGSLAKRAPVLDPEIMSALHQFGERVARGNIN